MTRTRASTRTIREQLSREVSFIENETSTAPILNPIVITESGKKLFCGCRVKSWSLVFAAVEIVIAVFALGNIILTMKSDSSVATLLVGIVALILGGFLFIGIFSKNRELLFVWLVLTGSGLAILVLIFISLVYAYLFVGSERFVLYFILLVTATFGLNYFCFRIVTIYRRELSDLKKQTEANASTARQFGADVDSIFVEMNLERESSEVELAEDKVEPEKEAAVSIMQFMANPSAFETRRPGSFRAERSQLLGKNSMQA